MKKVYHFIILFVLTITMFGTPHAQPVQAAGEHYSLRFYGHGAGDIDRVKIPIDDPSVPADVGGNFTIEFWMKADAAHNTSGPCTPGGDGWINGNIIIDRDIYGAGDYGDYGISLYGGRIAFGVANSSTSQTICGSASVADNAWHHIAVTRNQATGAMQIFVDGALDASGTGPTGDISYRNGRSTSYPDSDPYLVFGAEKHDAGPSYPSYNGFLDEVRISNSVRYTAAFDRPAAPLAADANTVALYRFDEGPEGDCTGGILDVLDTSHGFCSFGGAAPSGPVYNSADVPPIYQPDLVITGYELRDGPYPTGNLISQVAPNQTFWIWMTVENRGGGSTGNFYPGVFLDDKPNYGPDHDSNGAPSGYPVTLTLGEVTDYQGYKTTASNALDGAGCRYYDPSNLVNPAATNVLMERGNYHPIHFLPGLAAGTSATVSVQIAYPAGDYPDPIYDNIRTGLPAGSYNIYLYADPACNVDESLEGNNDYGPITLNVGGFPSGPTNVNVTIGGNLMGSYYMEPGQSMAQSYPGIMDGPVRVTSTNSLPIFASQRALVDGFSFNEYMGLTLDQMTNEYWFTWYDQYSPGLYTWILVGNPSETEEANVEIFIDGIKQGDTHIIPPNGRITPSYPGVMGGPVLVRSDIPIFTSERTIWAQNHNGVYIYDFNEVMGYPATQLTNEYWFTWYDQLSANTYAWVLVGNPSKTEDANVEIFIGGIKQGNTHIIPPNGRITPSYPGVMAGPVQVKSDIPVFASERVIAATSFNEVMGYPANQFDNEYWYPWYDNVNMYTWLLVGNPSPTLTAEVEVYIGGAQQGTRYIIPPNGHITPMYDGINGGPVRVVSVNGIDGVVDIFTSQRVIYLNGDKVGFNEMFGMPGFKANSALEYWFTWYDNITMNSDLRIGRP